METETLSSYRPQDKHILDAGMNVNIPNHDDEDSNSLHANEINEADSEPVSSSYRRDNENCDETVSSSENKLDNADKSEENVDGESDNTLSRSINSPNVSSTNLEEEEQKNSASRQESCGVNDEKSDPPNEERNESCTLSEERVKVQNISDNNSSCTENSTCGEKSLVDGANVATTSNQAVSENKGETTDPLECEKKDGKPEADSNSEKNSVDLATNEKGHENKDGSQTQDEKETNSESKVSEERIGEAFPLLKETLTKQKKVDSAEDKETENENGNEEMEIDDDFDPSLLCPDIAMEVDEAPVITTTDNLPTDGSKSPLLYEPVYSTYVDEMTGAEVTFNLTPEEHQMRQDTYGEKNPVQFTKIHCTACNVHLGSALDGQGNRFVHPLLKVLICKDCYHFYTSGEFEKDEDGSELYCRWCGQGGQVMCCSSCEMVFCKKCIRINFGRKKLTEIRDSDDWFCFRCNPSQLTELRVHCAEFMEYVRREISRAATLENATSFTTTDYTQCCLAQKKKYVDPNAAEPKKRKKKWHDPDYNPEVDMADPPNPSLSPPVEVKSCPPKAVPVLARPTDPNHSVGVVTHITQANTQNAVFRVGNTTFKPKVTAFPQVRPTLQVGQPISSTGIRPQCTTPGYIKIMPGGIRATTSPMHRQPAQTFVCGSVRPQSFHQRQIRTLGNVNPAMKHEWFEKTVRAAARVNSNLSYTLTQLNRAQASATSVEALAVVHNKLQEILSTSINSLIQIRKNLRTEFIAGIKNIRFPPKPPLQRPLPSTSAQDDDVIFISPTTSPVPPPVTVVTSNDLSPPNHLSPSVTATNSPTVLKRNPLAIVPTTSLQPIPSTSSISGNNNNNNNNGERPKMFLRVKSLSALQNVPSECITIPDDPFPTVPPPLLVPIKPPEEVTIVDDSPEKKNENPVRRESVKLGGIEEEQSEKEVSDPDPKEKCDNSTDEKNSNGDKSERNPSPAFSSKERPSVPELKKIKIRLARSDAIDKLVRNRFGLVNGDASE